MARLLDKTGKNLGEPLFRITVGKTGEIIAWESFEGVNADVTLVADELASGIGVYDPAKNGGIPKEDMPGCEIELYDPAKGTTLTYGWWFNPATGKVYICH